MATRSEWGRVAHGNVEYSLSDIIEVVNRRRAIWPVTNELKCPGHKGRADRKILAGTGNKQWIAPSRNTNSRNRSGPGTWAPWGKGKDPP